MWLFLDCFIFVYTPHCYHCTTLHLIHFHFETLMRSTQATLCTIGRNIVEWSALDGGECSASCPRCFTTWIKHTLRESLNTSDEITHGGNQILQFPTCSLVTTIIRLFQLQHCPVRSIYYRAPEYASVTILP